MTVFITVLAVALASLVASYFYLAMRWPTQPAVDVTEVMFVAGCAFFLLSGAAVLHVTTRRAAAGPGPRRIGLALASMMGIAALGLLWATYALREARFTRALDAHGSLVYTLLGFQGLVVLAGLVLMIVAQLWLWRRPADPRGDAVTELAVPYWYFTTVSAVAIFATVYL